MLKRKPDFDKALDTLKNIYEIVRKKNSDYGNIPYITGKIGVSTRILEKAMRLFNISKNKLRGLEPHFSESEFDTILDLVGYGLVWIAYFGGEEDE